LYLENYTLKKYQENFLEKRDLRKEGFKTSEAISKDMEKRKGKGNQPNPKKKERT